MFADEDGYVKGLTYLSDKSIECPVCGHEFYIEKLQTGGGRMIADDLTELLHRRYKPGQKFGKVFPLIYSPVVCPDCYFSSLPQDFLKTPPEAIEILSSGAQDRIEFANKIAGTLVDYTKTRTLESGAAAYALAIECYDAFPRKFTPVIKQAMCAIKAAFLFEDLELEKTGQYYDFLAAAFFKKALFLYKYSIELNQSKVQVLETMSSLGPDIDKDYGYDGITYLIATLTVKYGPKEVKEVRLKDLEEAKLYYGKLFGMGKSDANKPKEILDKARHFFEEITKEVNELNA